MISKICLSPAAICRSTSETVQCRDLRLSNVESAATIIRYCLLSAINIISVKPVFNLSIYRRNQEEEYQKTVLNRLMDLYKSWSLRCRNDHYSNRIGTPVYDLLKVSRFLSQAFDAWFL